MNIDLSRVTAKRGFTLIEVMIVVAIVGILAAIAYPSYLDSIQRSRRAEAQAALLELAQFMERSYTTNGSYLVSGSAPTLPFSAVPKDGGAAYYTLSLSATTAATYSLLATATGAQSSDACGNLGINQAGTKTVSGSKPLADCW